MIRYRANPSAIGHPRRTCADKRRERCDPVCVGDAVATRGGRHRQFCARVGRPNPDLAGDSVISELPRSVAETNFAIRPVVPEVAAANAALVSLFNSLSLLRVAPSAVRAILR